MPENPSENTTTVRKKKIALVSNSGWSVYNFRLDLIRHIRQRYEVLVLAPFDGFTRALEEQGCTCRNIVLDNRSENPFRDLALYRDLKRIYLEEQPDLVFHYVIKPNIYGSLAAAANGIASVAVITGLGYAFAKQNWLNRTVSFLYRRALKAPEEVWFLNQEDAEVFLQRGLVKPEKIKQLPGEGINTSFFAPTGFKPVARTKAFQFLMSTRLLRSKGIADYVAAARILKEKNYLVRFELIGFFEQHHPDSITGTELRSWQRKGVIHYGGFARDVRPFLRQADCLVFPSYYNEGVPRCLLEAASMEIPIITSLNRGCREVVEDGVNGYLTATNDAPALVKKMEAMMSLSSAQRAVMGRRGRERVTERFGMERILAEYDRVLDAVIGSGQGAPK